ncbi:helix-turn-helix domain-containing protein [Thalassolituus sp. LLYu03]|uniref:helix-turn-helix domain-containing protein n=1 Tax=Thalassolituus sp. LLYu03 TaxID=3421656 RepID=UPI003D2D47D6
MSTLYIYPSGCSYDELARLVQIGLSGNIRAINSLETKLMVRFRLKELIADKEFKEGRRITLEEVSRETGIHRTTLSKIANQKGYVTNTDVLDRLCVYFEVPIGSIAEHLPTVSEPE